MVENLSSKVSELNSKLEQLQGQMSMTDNKIQMKQNEYGQYQQILKPIYGGQDVEVEDL